MACWAEENMMRAWESVPRQCRSPYTDLYATAASYLGWQVTILSKAESRILVHPPGVEPFEIRKHNCKVLYHSLSIRRMRDKRRTNNFLMKYSIPVPRSVFIRKGEEFRAHSTALRYPVVVKPICGTKGDGVTLLVPNEDKVIKIVNSMVRPVDFIGTKKIPKLQHVQIQEFVPGKDYRVLILDGEVIDVARRIPASVFGDGRRTTRQLVEIANRKRRSCRMPIIKLDKALGPFYDVPIKNFRRFVQNKANVSLGGLAVKILVSSIHPDNLAMFRRIGSLFPRHRCIGADFIGDIRQPVRPPNELDSKWGGHLDRSPMRGCIIELNGTSQIFCHSVRGGTIEFDVLKQILQAAALRRPAVERIGDIGLNYRHLIQNKHKVKTSEKTSRCVEKIIVPNSMICTTASDILEKGEFKNQIMDVKEAKNGIKDNDNTMNSKTTVLNTSNNEHKTKPIIHEERSLNKLSEKKKIISHGFINHRNIRKKSSRTKCVSGNSNGPRASRMLRGALAAGRKVGTLSKGFSSFVTKVKNTHASYEARNEVNALKLFHVYDDDSSNSLSNDSDNKRSKALVYGEKTIQTAKAIGTFWKKVTIERKRKKDLIKFRRDMQMIVSSVRGQHNCMKNLVLERHDNVVLCKTIHDTDKINAITEENKTLNFTKEAMKFMLMGATSQIMNPNPVVMNLPKYMKKRSRKTRIASVEIPSREKRLFSDCHLELIIGAPTLDKSDHTSPDHVCEMLRCFGILGNASSESSKSSSTPSIEIDKLEKTNRIQRKFQEKTLEKILRDGLTSKGQTSSLPSAIFTLTLKCKTNDAIDKVYDKRKTNEKGNNCYDGIATAALVIREHCSNGGTIWEIASVGECFSSDLSSEKYLSNEKCKQVMLQLKSEAVRVKSILRSALFRSIQMIAKLRGCAAVMTSISVDESGWHWVLQQPPILSILNALVYINRSKNSSKETNGKKETLLRLLPKSQHKWLDPFDVLSWPSKPMESFYSTRKPSLKYEPGDKPPSLTKTVFQDDGGVKGQFDVIQDTRVFSRMFQGIRTLSSCSSNIATRKSKRKCSTSDGGIVHVWFALRPGVASGAPCVSPGWWRQFPGWQWKMPKWRALPKHGSRKVRKQKRLIKTKQRILEKGTETKLSETKSNETKLRGNLSTSFSSMNIIENEPIVNVNNSLMNDTTKKKYVFRDIQDTSILDRYITNIQNMSSKQIAESIANDIKDVNKRELISEPVLSYLNAKATPPVYGKSASWNPNKEGRSKPTSQLRLKIPSNRDKSEISSYIQLASKNDKTKIRTANQSVISHREVPGIGRSMNLRHRLVIDSEQKDTNRLHNIKSKKKIISPNK